MSMWMWNSITIQSKKIWGAHTDGWDRSTKYAMFEKTDSQTTVTKHGNKTPVYFCNFVSSQSINQSDFIIAVSRAWLSAFRVLSRGLVTLMSDILTFKWQSVLIVARKTVYQISNARCCCCPDVTVTRTAIWPWPHDLDHWHFNCINL